MQITKNIENSHLKKNPFQVPPGYFDFLPQQIGQKIEHTSTSGTHRKFSYQMLRPQLALAASFIILVGLGYGIVQLITPKTAEPDLLFSDRISLFDTYTLLQDNALDDESLDSELIITFLTDHGISPNTVASLE